MPHKYRVSASNTLALVDSATELWYNRVSAESNLVLSDEAILNHKLTLTGNVFIFSQTVTTNNIINQVAETIIEFYDSTFKTSSIYENVVTTLDITQNVNQNIKYGVAESVLELEQEATDFKPIQASAISSLLYATDFPNEGLRHEVQVRLILTPHLTSYVNLSQNAGSVKVLEASNHLHLSHSTYPTLYDALIHTIIFTHQVSYTISKPLSSVLNLTDSVTVDGVVAKSLESDLNLQQAASYYTINFCEDTSLLRRTSIILTYPYVSPITTLEMRNPDFDNVEQFEYRKINRRSRGGTLQIYRDSAWPQAERLIMTFSALSQSKVKSLMDFMNQSLGKEIGILDFESRQWRGIILTPSAPTSEEGSKGFSASFEFEGMQV